jgi:hypothetical protein
MDLRSADAWSNITKIERIEFATDCLRDGDFAVGESMDVHPEA